MDKLKRFVKHLFAPAIVLILVAIMGVFSPVVSVAAALRVNTMATGPESEKSIKIENLPARSVEVNTKIKLPELIGTGASFELWHAGAKVTTSGDEYTYEEVGQYEWRFFIDGVLYKTQKVAVTDATYAMTMADAVVTVAPKNLDSLQLPLPISYKVDGEAIKVKSITQDGNACAVITTEEDVKYTLKATATLENRALVSSKIVINQNGMTIDLSDINTTGNLKVAYELYNKDATKLLVVSPLKNIEIKNVNKDEVTFANIPTAPSVKNLAYYTTATLTAPTADSAKVGTTSFNVDAQTKIFKVQCSPYATEPSDWSKADNKIHTLTVEKNGEGKWIVKEENGNQTNDYLEIDGLNVKVKKLGWYRFQFETSTLFGYKLDETVDVDDLNIQQDKQSSYVRYWSNSVHISSDQSAPSFAWVDDYVADNQDAINEMDENYSDLASKYKNYLPMTDKADAKKVTVNGTLVLPAIFPHDNATQYKDMVVSSFSVSQIQDENGESVSNNSARSGSENTKTVFTYDMTQHLTIAFNDDANRVCGENEVILLNKKGLYQIAITIKESEAKYADGKVGGYARSKQQSYYFYYDGEHVVDSPVIDEEKKFQVSDVYLWEGNTFEFKKPNISDANTATNKIQTDYYLVGKDNSNDLTVLSKLDGTANVLNVNVDLNNLKDYNNEEITLDLDTVLGSYESFYIYTVARNFNAMQANLKNDLHITLNAGDFFDAETSFQTNKAVDTFERNGYAWKRAEFNIHEADNATAATIATDVTDPGNVYESGKTIKINSVVVNWGTEIDGQMSVAAYQVKANNVLVPVNVVNSDNAVDAEIISSVAFRGNSHTLENLYFTPSSKGDYIFVVTAKNHASSNVSTSVTKITIGASNDWSASPLSLNTAAAGSATIDNTMVAGETMVLPNFKVGPEQEYVTKNRKLYNATSGAEIGNYTITVLGVNDANCITGNKFTPNKAGQYTLRHTYFVGGVEQFKQDYIVQVNENTNTSSNILMGENYKDEAVLWNDSVTEIGGGDTYEVAGKTYDLGSGGTGTSKKPAYAITLNQFVMSNYGAATDFVVDSASLFPYLEPIFEDGEIKEYMYPAIAIPMPNLISEDYSSDEVEITVQKSGNSNYLVSSKKKNAGGSTDKASVIENIDGFYVFRPEGKFSKDCKEKYNATNYLEPENSTSVGVYTVTYKTQNTELSFNVTFGNLKNGTLAWNKGFLTYNNDDGKGNQEINSDNTDDVVIEEINGHRYVTIDMSKVYFTGNADMQALIAKGPNPDNNNDGYSAEQFETAYYWENARVTVTFEGGAFIDNSDWSDAEDETKAIKITDDGKFMYKFDLSQGSGTYKVNISLPNKYTATSVSASIEFTIDVDVTNRNHNLNNVWGVILIVLSLGLLAGVIYYFIKTSRATRFVDTPRAMKNKDKKVKAPKTEAPKVEAPKEDVK